MSHSTHLSTSSWLTGIKSINIQSDSNLVSIMATTSPSSSGCERSSLSLSTNSSLSTPPSSATATDFQEVLKLVRIVIAERDRLQEELVHGKLYIAQLKTQIDDYSSNLSRATSAIHIANRVADTYRTATPFPSPAPAVPNPPIKDLWPANIRITHPTISTAFTSWTRSSPLHQRSIALLSSLLVSSSPEAIPTLKDRLTCKLLLTAILLDCTPPQHRKALTHAEETVRLADGCTDRQAMGQAQLYRGKALIALGRLSEARWCYILGAGTRGFEGVIESWKTEVDGLMDDFGRSQTDGGESMGIGRGFAVVPREKVVISQDREMKLNLVREKGSRMMREKRDANDLLTKSEDAEVEVIALREREGMDKIGERDIGDGITEGTQAPVLEGFKRSS